MEKKKILVVDDEIDFTQILRANLESTDAYIVRVENLGSFTLKAAREFRPDLILLDIMMPDMQGSEVAVQLKQDAQCKDIPVIFLTALVTNKDNDKSCTHIAGHPFIGKPFETQNLIDCIEDNLKKKK
jgi:CheY-like chemotaxis protein